MKGKTVVRIRWEEGLMKRIENRQTTITAAEGMDLHKYGYVLLGKKGNMVRWREKEEYNRRRSYIYHKNHPGATFYFKETSSQPQE
jgi:hypothetical protein